MFKSFLNCLSTCLRDPLHHPENLPTSGIGAKKGNPHTGGWHHQRKWEGAAYFFPPNHKEGSEVRCRRPHLGSLSAVQQWFRRASHKKNLQRNGTQDFQILFQRAKRIVPTKKNGLFGGFPGVCTWAGQLPCMLVLHIRVQNYFFRSNFHDRDR